jgi:hypothetical protein
MASLGRSLMYALTVGAAGGAVVSLLRQQQGSSRPLVKRAIRAGVLAFDQARQTVGEFSETASDLVAEARAELEDERQHSAQADAGGGDQIFPFATRAASEAERKAHG